MSNTIDKKLLSEKELQDMRMIAFNSYDDFSKYAAAKILQMYDHIEGLKRKVAILQSGAFDIPNNQSVDLLNRLNAFIDFSQPLDNGDWGIENTNSINSLFSEIVEFLNTSVSERERCELCPDDESTCYCYDDKPKTSDPSVGRVDEEKSTLQMRGLTKEESEIHEDGLNRLFKPTGRNLFNSEPSVDRVRELQKALEWANRIIGSGLDIGVPLRYDPMKWLQTYHSKWKEETKDD